MADPHLMILIYGFYSCNHFSLDWAFGTVIYAIVSVNLHPGLYSSAVLLLNWYTDSDRKHIPNWVTNWEIGKYNKPSIIHIEHMMYFAVDVEGESEPALCFRKLLDTCFCRNRLLHRRAFLIVHSALYRGSGMRVCRISLQVNLCAG